MDTGRRVLQRWRSDVGGGAYRGMQHQVGYGVKGIEFQQGHGVKGVEFQRGHGVKGVEFQQGHGVKGVEFQQGHGIRCGRFRQRGAGWGWLTKVASRALPFLARGAKTVGKHALAAIADQTMNTGVRLLDDVLEGENVLESAKRRLKQGGDELRNTAKAKAREGGLRVARSLKRKIEEHRNGDDREPLLQEGEGRRRKRRRQPVIRKRGVEAKGRCCSITKKRKTIPYQNPFGGDW